MKLVLPVFAGIAVVISIAAAKHHGVDNTAVLHIPIVVNHQYAPLTSAQKAAAVKLFKLSLTPSNTTTTYTLSAESAYSGPLGAGLSASGISSVGLGSNQIYLYGVQQGWAEVILANNSASASYLVTYNVNVIGQPVTLTLTTGTVSATVCKNNPTQPMMTIPAGQFSIPFVLAPGYNSTCLTLPQGPSQVVLDSVTVQQL